MSAAQIVVKPYPRGNITPESQHERHNYTVSHTAIDRWEYVVSTDDHQVRGYTWTVFDRKGKKARRRARKLARRLAGGFEESFVLRSQADKLTNDHNALLARTARLEQELGL